MGEKRNFAALESVSEEVLATLNDAHQALEAYVADPKDEAKIRFCITYLHEVHGCLKMVEFHGAALKAEVSCARPDGARQVAVGKPISQ